MNLTSTTHSLELVTTTAATLAVTVEYMDITVSTGAGVIATQRTLVSSATTTTILGAPTGTKAYAVTSITVRNTHGSLACDVVVQTDVSTVNYPEFGASLAAGETFRWRHDGEPVLLTAAGVPKVQRGDSATITNALNVVVLGSDVINNNAVANTMQDVTGLEFSVVAGETYWLDIVIPYTSAATTTGSRWSINGPANPTMLNMRSEYTLTATTTTVNSITAYDTPAASNASSLTTGNVATLWGFIKPSGNGTVIARFASEVLSSAITAKAGATLRWMRVL